LRLASIAAFEYRNSRLSAPGTSLADIVVQV